MMNMHRFYCGFIHTLMEVHPARPGFYRSLKWTERVPNTCNSNSNHQASLKLTHRNPH